MTGSHIQNCPDCLAKVGELLKDDSLLAEIRGAFKAGTTTANRTVVEQIVRRVRPADRSAAGADVSFLAPPLPEFPGDLGRLDRYRIVAMLGKGGMGIVFRAIDPTLQREVALKVIIPKYAANEKLRQRFLAEARATVAVRSPHVAEVYDCGVWNNVPYLTMELLNGVSLDKRPKPMPIDAWRRIGFGIAKGLADAHRVGMIHRDLKPGNVHLGTDARTGKPTVKIIDFGLARPVERAVEITNAGETLGTPAYMSPEQAAGKKVDHRTDLYALGVILYQLASGKLPYSNAKDGVFAIISELASPQPLPSIKESLPQLHPIMIELIDRLLAKDPDQRPSSADEVLNRFRESVESDKKSSGTDVVASAPYLSTPNLPSDTLPFTPQTLSFDATSTESREARAAAARRQPARSRPVGVMLAIGFGVLVGGALIGLALGAFNSDNKPAPEIAKPSPATLQIPDTPTVAPVLQPPPEPVPQPPAETTFTLNIDLSLLPEGSEVLIDGVPAEIQRHFGLDTNRAMIKVGRKAEYAIVIRRGQQVIRRGRIAIPANVGNGDSVTVKNDSVRFDKLDPEPIRSNLFLVHGGNWERTDQEIFLTAHDLKPYQKIVFGDVKWADYIYRLDFCRAGSASGGFDVHFRCASALEEYILRFGGPEQSGGVLIAADKRGGKIQLATLDYAIGTDRWYSLTIRAIGTRITATIENDAGEIQSLVSVISAAHSSGMVGLSQSRTGYRFRNFSVTAIDGRVLWEGLPNDDAEVKRVAALPAHLKAVDTEGPLAADWVIEPFSTNRKWSTRDGIITGTNTQNLNQRSYLLSKKDYEDFRLRFEYQIESIQSYGGVALRATPGEQLPQAFGLRLLDHPLLRLSSTTKFDDPTGTAHYLTQDPKRGPRQSPRLIDNKWHPVDITVKGDSCTATIDDLPVADLKYNPKAALNLNYIPALARKSGRIGFQINYGTIAFRNIKIDELQAEKPATVSLDPPPVPPPPITNGLPATGPDPFKADTSWHGVKIVDRGNEIGQTSFYELSIETRTGDTFTGTIVENGLNQRTLSVKGTVAGTSVQWREIDKKNPTHAGTVSGTFSNGLLSLDIKDDTAAGATGIGKAKLFRTRVAAARDTFDEFYPIFNGRNLGAWWNTDLPGASDWEVTKRGTLAVKGDKAGHLYTKHVFGDVHIWCRVRVNDGGQGGVFVRGQFGPAGNPFPEGYRAVVAAGLPKLKSGSLRAWDKSDESRIAEPVKPNQWFDLEMIVRGNTVEIRVDGKVAVTYKDITVRPPTGRIVLQQFDARSKIEFAMIAIKELKPK